MKSIRTGTLAIFFLLCASSARAEDARFYIHSAERGDTLQKLANRYLHNKNDWQLFQIFNTINNPRAIPLGTKIRMPVSAMRVDPAPGEVIAASGSVTSAAGSIVPGSKVKEGDRLRTGDDSFVTIKLADGSTLTVQPKSIVRMEAARQLANTGGVTDTVVRLDSGRVETNVAKQKNAAARYEIRTPTSNMGVRGTLFRVGADESGKKGQGEVVEGLVAVSGATSSAGTQSLALSAGFGTFVEAGKPPSPPVALLPPPNVASLPLQFQTPDVGFAFQPVAAAGSYRAQVAMDKGFTNLVANAVSTTPAATFANLPDGSLFLRVRGIDVNGLEGKDATHSFVVKARPLPPVLSAPGDNDRLLTSNVSLNWQAAPEAVSYRAQMATDGSFASPVTDEKTASGASLTPTVVLKAATYFWRVASVNAKGETGPWSAVRTFVGAADLPPILKAKRSAGASQLEIDASAAQTHQVQIARDQRFTNIASDRNITGNKFDLGNLGVGGYYIRVRAVVGSVIGNEKAVGPWSESRVLEVYPFGGGWWLSESQAQTRAPAGR